MCHAGQYHTWRWVGSYSGEELPEGIACDCGAEISRYDTCPTCKQRRFNPIPNPLWPPEAKVESHE